VWTVVKLIILSAGGQYSCNHIKQSTGKHGTDRQRGKISLLANGKRGKIKSRLALILPLIGREDSVFALIGESELIFPRNNRTV